MQKTCDLKKIQLNILTNFRFFYGNKYVTKYIKQLQKIRLYSLENMTVVYFFLEFQKSKSMKLLAKGNVKTVQTRLVIFAQNFK